MTKVIKTIGQTVVMFTAMIAVTANVWGNTQPDSPDGPSPTLGHPVCCFDGPPNEPVTAAPCTRPVAEECDVQCVAGSANCVTVKDATGANYSHLRNYNHNCGSYTVLGNCTPEMSDYLALTLVLAIAGRIYYFRRRSQAIA